MSDGASFLLLHEQVVLSREYMACMLCGGDHCLLLALLLCDYSLHTMSPACHCMTDLAIPGSHAMITRPAKVMYIML